jgi:predicted nucleotide-binding protein
MLIAILERQIEAGNDLIQKPTSNSTKKFEDFDREFLNWDRRNGHLLKIDVEASNSTFYYTYNKILQFEPKGVYTAPTPVKKHGFRVNEIKSKVDYLSLIIEVIELEQDNDENLIPKSAEVISEKEALDANNRIFIVHGHDNELKETVARFLSLLDLEPIILHEQLSSSSTIIEKLERETANVGYGIVLYTSCDSGCKKGDEANLKSRARQNVVFEHGMLIGLIGRANTCVIAEDGVELPNDISGIVYNPSGEDWKTKLVKELRGAGYSVNTDKWLK